MADTPNIHYVTTNMAAKRNATFTNTNLHGVNAYTYVTIQNGRHTKIHYVSAIDKLQLPLSTYTCLLQDGVDSTGYKGRVDSTGNYIRNYHIKSRALTS
jgi:hypothetical protein